MADVFDPLAKAKTAQRLIDKFGELVTLRTFAKPIAAVDDPTPWAPATAPSPEFTDQKKIRVAFFPAPGDKPMKTYANGSMQRAGDLWVLIGSNAKPAPDVGSILIRGDGSKWTLLDVDTLAPNGVPIMHDGMARV